MGSGGEDGSDDDIGRGSNVGAGPAEDGRVGEREQQFGRGSASFPGAIFRTREETWPLPQCC